MKYAILIGQSVARLPYLYIIYGKIVPVIQLRRLFCSCSPIMYTCDCVSEYNMLHMLVIKVWMSVGVWFMNTVYKTVCVWVVVDGEEV